MPSDGAANQTRGVPLLAGNDGVEEALRVTRVHGAEAEQRFHVLL